MPKPAAPLAPELRSQPFTLAEAALLGASSTRLRRADVRRLYRGVYAPIGLELDLAARCRAFLLTAPEHWVICGVTAAMLHGMPLPRRCEEDPRLHAHALGGENPPRRRGVRGSRGDPGSAPVELHGVRLLGPTETWAGLEPFLGIDELAVAGDRLWDPFDPLAGEAEPGDLIDRMEGRRGVRRLSAAHRLMRPGAHSPGETRLRLTLERAGMPTGCLNQRIVASSGRVFYGDLVVERYRTIFEYDGEQHRLDDRQWGRDVSRTNALAADGWLLVRFTKRHDDAEVVRLARRALSSRGWKPRE